MKIGLILYGLDRPLTGIGRYTLELVQALGKLQPRPEITLMFAGKGNDLLSSNGLGQTSLPGSRLLPSLMTWGQVAIWRRAKEVNLEIIHDPIGVSPTGISRHGKATVTTIHDVIPYTYPETSTTLDWLIYHFWLPLAVRWSDAIITDSTQSKEDIVRFLRAKENKVTVVPLAANDDYHPMRNNSVMAALETYEIRKPFILTVGSLESRKNLPRLLEAYARLRHWSEKWTLVIVGARKWKYAPIFETVQRLELEHYVRFTGYVEEEDLPALYNGADLFVFPSLYEGFGLPVLEAMACGTPVVTSNTSSLPEVAGDAALLVDPYDVEEIATAMRRILEDEALAAELRAKGLARAKEFSWERTARETIAVYEKVLGKKLL